MSPLVPNPSGYLIDKLKRVESERDVLLLVQREVERLLLLPRPNVLTAIRLLEKVRRDIEGED